MQQWIDSTAPDGAEREALGRLPPLVLWLRLAAVALSVVVVVVVTRLLTALPSSVGFLVAILAALSWAYRFER
jgi:hypothetical protein